MNANRSALLARASALILTTLTAAAAQATPRCDNPTFPVDRVACAKAKESPEALRRFIERTQSIHMLYFWDYMSEADLERHHARRQAPDRRLARETAAMQAELAPPCVGPAKGRNPGEHHEIDF